MAQNMMSLDSSDFDAKARMLLKRSTGAQMLPAVKAGGFVVEGAAKINVRDKLYRHPTGNLMNSIHVATDEVGAHSASVSIGTNVIYAAIHEFGGIIKAKNGPFLHFVIDGKHIMTKSVQIPARPYIRPAMDENKPRILQAVSYQLKKLLSL